MHGVSFFTQTSYYNSNVRIIFICFTLLGYTIIKESLICLYTAKEV